MPVRLPANEPDLGVRTNMIDRRSEHVKAPSKLLMLLEGRALWELGALAVAYPLLRTAPRGDGHSVLVLPGLVASDASTVPLRRFLAEQGYDPHGWKQGRNLGPRPGVEERMLHHLRTLHEQSGRKVSVVGWSLGGVYARELARRAPDAVRQVITLGSPLRGRPTSTNAWKLYERVSGKSANDSEHHRHAAPPPVPSTAIFSRTDGIVAWPVSLEPDGPFTESIEVTGSHCGLGHNPAALYAIADRLAQPEGQWAPFDRSGLRSAFYGNGALRRSTDAAMAMH